MKTRMRHSNCFPIGMVVAMTLVTSAFSAVERADYSDSGSNVQRRRMESEQRGYAASDSASVAFAIAPRLEWPSAEYEVKGFRLSFFAGDHVDVYGLDLGVVGNFVKREVGGLQIGGLFNAVGEADCAFQVAAACNYCSGDFGGVQIGFVNIAEKGRGLQVGLVNRSNLFYGVQIGLANFNGASFARFFPIVNCAF